MNARSLFAIAFGVLCVALPAAAQNASVGLYVDGAGYTCSFSGDAPGLITAYVVLRPDAGGITGIQFAAPIPPCFGGIFVSESVAGGALIIGDSQTGASIVLSGCAFNPINVLQITYFRSGGGTTPCCEYPIVPDPSLAVVTGTNCSFQEIPVAAVTSRFNSDASCECHGNSAPSLPSNPFPQDNTAGQSTVPAMSWFSFDIDGNLAEYDLYLGTTTTPPLVASGLTEQSYVPAPLALNQQHYWRIVARDALGLETAGPLWTFRTRSSNGAPFPPQDPSPVDGESLVALDADLSWTGFDPEGDVLRYDVYFGTSPTPPLVAEDLTVSAYEPGALQLNTQYHWRVVASDGVSETSGPTWNFTTRDENIPPTVPTSPSPANNSVGVSRIANLSWLCTDPDGDAIVFDVYFGSSSPPPLVISNIGAASYDPGLLSPLTDYYWRIEAHDALGGTTSGPIWTFETGISGNSPPNPPFNPNPPNNGPASPTPVLTWDASDPDSDPLTYNVYLGTSAVSQPLVASGLTTKSYAPGTLSLGAQYYWRVEVSDGEATTLGPVWTFITILGGNGDVNNDGQVTLDDARCGLTVALGGVCGGGGAAQRADVDCSAQATPRDARCIHKNVLDGSCTFCGGNAPVAAPREGVLFPNVTVLPTWAVGDTLITQVFVSGVPSLEAFGFRVLMDFNVSLVRAVRIGATLGWEGMQCVPSPAPGFVPAGVGGYTTGSVPASSQVALVELHFLLNGDVGFARIEGYQDDLAGAPAVGIRVSDDGPLPVFITRFEAVQSGEAVEIAWELSSDEPVDTYRLYRRAGTAAAVLIAQGDAAATRSFLDSDVEPATTYQYELVIRTENGDEYRSQPATVTTAELTLALGQNHPNPFNPSTTIPFTIPSGDSDRHVKLIVFDTAGRAVRTLLNETKSSGTHSVTWDGRDDGGRMVSSGVYFYVLDVGGDRRTRKMVLLK
ncbi:MAG TPA: FlgD immunoglobulin-like domain containing protein [Candidatus Krumholzibacteria bacterium]|nr:FlgD immunoglobulin-like domain containing protein [Candidatus Krumholzibacteria bacterium]